MRAGVSRRSPGGRGALERKVGDGHRGSAVRPEGKGGARALCGRCLAGWIALLSSRYDPRFVHFLSSLSQQMFLGLLGLSAGILTAVLVKRLHDVGLSGRNAIWILILALLGDPLETRSPILMV